MVRRGICHICVFFGNSTSDVGPEDFEVSESIYWIQLRFSKLGTQENTLLVTITRTQKFTTLLEFDQLFRTPQHQVLETVQSEIPQKHQTCQTVLGCRKNVTVGPNKFIFVVCWKYWKWTTRAITIKSTGVSKQIWFASQPTQIRQCHIMFETLRCSVTFWLDPRLPLSQRMPPDVGSPVFSLIRSSLW